MDLRINPRLIRLRHARHYITIATQAQQQYQVGSESIAAGLNLFDQERANLDTARRWLQSTSGDAEVDQLLIDDGNATVHIGDLRYSKRDERIPQLEAAWAAATRLRHREAQGVFLGNLGSAHLSLGEAHKAIEYSKQDLNIALELGDRLNQGSALGNLGNAYKSLGNTHKAIEYYHQSLAIARELNDQRSEGTVIANLGQAYNALGETRKAINLYNQCLAVVRNLGDRRGEGVVIGSLGAAYQALGDVVRASKYYEQWLDIAREIGDRSGEGMALTGLGRVYSSSGDTHKAIEYHRQWLNIARENGDRSGEGLALNNLGEDYFILGDKDNAVEYFQRALAVSRKIGDRRAEGQDLRSLGSAYGRFGDVSKAIECYQQALHLMHEVDDQSGAAEVEWDYGITLVQGGDPAQALSYLDHGLAFYQGIAHRDVAMMTEVIAHVRSHGTLPAQQSSTNELSADLLDRIAQAIAAQDNVAFQAALETLTEDERTEVISRLQDGGLLELIDTPEEVSDEATGIAPVFPLSLAQEGDTEGESDAPFPAVIQSAIIAGDSVLLYAALAMLPVEERARVEALLQQATEQAIVRMQSNTPEEIFAGLPASVRVALVQQDEAAVQAALTGLPKDKQQHVLADLQTLGLLAAQEAQQRSPHKHVAALLSDIARVAGGDDLLRIAVEQTLDRMEQGGWMLREPVARIWAGERDRAALIEGLNERDATQIGRILVLIKALDGVAEPERNEQEAILSELPETMRAAILNKDAQAFDAALVALPAEEAQIITERLEAAGIIGIASLPDQLRPDIDDVIQNFLPLLGDIALATFGDDVARQLVEAVLPQLEQSGWQFNAAVQRIWAGERDAEQLTAGIDSNSAALLSRTLRLIENGPELIFAARSIQIASLSNQAEQFNAQALASGDAGQRAELVYQLGEIADQAEQQPGLPWQELAAHLRRLAARLTEA